MIGNAAINIWESKRNKKLKMQQLFFRIATLKKLYGSNK
jgi:hypothetical protein